VEVVAPLSQGRTAATQFGLFTYKSVPSYLNHLVDWVRQKTDCKAYKPPEDK